MTGSMDILCVALFREAEVESRERLFKNNSRVEVKDDTGKLVSSHPDWDEHTYAEIISVFSQEDDYVYLPRIMSGKDSKMFKVISSHLGGSEIYDPSLYLDLGFTNF